MPGRHIGGCDKRNKWIFALPFVTLSEVAILPLSFPMHCHKTDGMLQKYKSKDTKGGKSLELYFTKPQFIHVNQYQTHVFAILQHFDFQLRQKVNFETKLTQGRRMKSKLHNPSGIIELIFICFLLFFFSIRLECLYSFSSGYIHMILICHMILDGPKKMIIDPFQ